MTVRLWLDLETYSRVDLRKSNPYRYAEDDHFQILMAAWSTDGELVHVVEHDEVDQIPGLWDPDVIKVAHNAPFERICLSAHHGLPVGEYLDPESFHDTQAVAAEQGYPQGLDNLARALGAQRKDGAGTALINFFCKPNRHGERNLPEDHPEKWAAFLAYCGQDVHTLIDVDRKLGGLKGWPTRGEQLIYFADQRINDNGMKIDVEMAELAVAAAEDNRMVQELEVSAMTGVENPSSQPQMMEWCKRVGLPNEDLRAETVEELLELDDLNDDVRRVLELRQELALSAYKKFAAALDGVSSDGRLRGAFRFFGAHTARWTGRGAQPQNLPRLSFENTADTELCIAELRNGEEVSAEDLKRLVRPLFIIDGAVVDYSAIEARVIAWLGGEEWALEAFRKGRDIYVETAKRMSTDERPLTRAQGKVAVLALGFAGGTNSLRVMGADGSDDELQMLVTQWRKANRRIVRLWRDIEDAVAHGGQVGPHLRLERSGSDLKMHLPSGRFIAYHGVKWEHYTVLDKKTGRRIQKEGWRYTDPKGHGRIGTYGGRLAENATQAVARDLLAASLVRLQNRGFKPVAHVHDEALVEGARSVAEVADVMTVVPSWATGLPIDAEGFLCDRYRKD